MTEFLGPQRAKLVLLAALLLGGIAMQLALPQLMAAFLDGADTGAALRDLLWLAIAFCAVGLGQQVLLVLASYIGAMVSWRATNRLRESLMEHCLRLDLSFHHAHSPGEMIERIDGDARALNNFFSELGVKVAGNLLVIVGVLALLFWENWMLGVAFAAFTALAVAVFERVRHIAGPYWVKVGEASADLYSETEDWFGGLDDVRAGGAQAHVRRRFALALRKLFRANRKAIGISVAIGNGSDLFLVLGGTALLGCGAFLYLQGTISIGTVFAIIMYTAMISGPLQEIVEQIDDLQRVSGALTRIDELRKAKPTLHEGPGAELGAGALPVVFESVTFAYPAAEPASDEEDRGEAATGEPVLRDVSLSVAAGEVVGLIGRTGSGKSTLTRLLLRLYDPGSGVVRIGGRDLRELTWDQLRGSVGVVTQEVQLFHATVRDNLTMFGRHLPDEQLVELIERVGLADWFADRAEGLDTVLEPDGKGMSTGEGQLLAVARVFAADPAVVILDEPTSWLDPNTEHRLRTAFDRLLEGRTGLIVAHRMHMVDRADTIVALERGVIVEQGPRERLAADPDSAYRRALDHSAAAAEGDR